MPDFAVDSSGFLSVVSLILAAVALTVSWQQARRSTQIARHANEIQVVADIFRDVRSKDFRSKFDRVVANPPDGASLEGGFNSLQGEMRESAYAVCYFFEDLGVLVTHGLIRSEVILETVSSVLTRAWQALEPAITAEREYRQRTYPAEVSPTFLPHFERLVVMATSRRKSPGRRAPASRVGGAA